MKQKCYPQEQSEALRRRWKSGQEQHQEQKTRTVSTCLINPGGLSLKKKSKIFKTCQKLLSTIFTRHQFSGPFLSKQGSTPTSWAWGLRDQSKNGRSRHRRPFMHRAYSGTVLGGGLRPWSETIVLEGAGPWGGGRLEFANLWRALRHASSKRTSPKIWKMSQKGHFHCSISRS